MKVDLRFSDRPLESLWCQAVAALVFQCPNLTGEMLSGLNEKMAGFLTHLQEKGIWTGDKGETLLLASQDAIKADKILLKGLGESAYYDKDLLVNHTREVGVAFERMGVREFGICIPMVKGHEKAYTSYLEICARQLVHPFSQNHRGESDFILKIIFSVAGCTADILNPVATRLREYFESRLDCSVVISLEGKDQGDTLAY